MWCVCVCGVYVYVCVNLLFFFFNLYLFTSGFYLNCSLNHYLIVADPWNCNPNSAISLDFKSPMFNCQVTVSMCLHCVLLKKKKKSQFFLLSPFPACMVGWLWRGMCVCWGVGKLSHQWFFNRLTSVSQHIPGRQSSCRSLDKASYGWPFYHRLHLCSPNS